ncbi:MAG TPA: M48 family metallopeptidase, partial [Candidatus Ozemobacteraceae bacterium]|nr:M48 family metallopeptidase [Candidatus Ozemobacteraceae bacterium]
MDETQFEAFSSRLEREAAEHPRWYRLKVIGLAMSGYLFIAGVLLGIVGVIAALVAAAVSVHGSAYVVVKVLGVLIPLGWIILRSLWVSLPPPEGLHVDLGEAPKLRSVVENLKRTLKTPDIDVVLLTLEFNAGVVQIPRFGIFGWPRNYLVLGWPLLLALSPEGVTSVLAHEFGHLSGAHGRFAAWVYRVRQTWFSLMTALEANGQWGTGLFRWFFNWYAPSFGAYTFVLARKHEFAADRMAARATGARITAETLLSTVVLEAHLDDGFWPKLKDLSLTLEAPPDDVFARMRQALAEPIPEENAEKWSRKARCFRTGGGDTHPALSDRLAVLGSSDVRYHPFMGPCAADVFFPGEAGRRIERMLSAQWRENVADAWAEAHRNGVGAISRLAELETLEKAGRFGIDEAVERLRHVGELHGVEATEPLLLELVRTAPDHPQVCYGMGRLLLRRGDLSGVAYID